MSLASVFSLAWPVSRAFRRWTRCSAQGGAVPADISKNRGQRLGGAPQGVHCSWLAVGRAGAMATDISFSRSDQSKILSRLRTLRTNLAYARDALMHFKNDRLDRDKLEPAARRVDDLMNMFVSNSSDRAQGSSWISEIQIGVEQVTNPKAADALRDARLDISALLDLMSLDRKGQPVEIE
jgi:hypothetical protein